MSQTCPGLFIAAPQGRSGKTTFSLGICSLLNQRGFHVQPFKKGPDYIDPSWLSLAAGHDCRTLDPFFQHSNQKLKSAYARGILGADLGLIEGNHGLFDSVDQSGLGSSAAVARILDTPILLVINAARMGRSVAAMVQGCQNFEPETPIAGVVLNNVAGKRHEAKLRTAIETYCGVPVLGAIPRDEAVRIPDRHLGLIPSGEDDGLISAIEACRRAVDQFVDVDAVLGIARTSRSSPVLDQQGSYLSHTSFDPKPILGVIKDRAFSFYYVENIEALKQAGAQLTFIDSLNDTTLPEVDGLYIGGGFPEMFLEQLEANHRLRKSIHQVIKAGLPVYAECGGLMYLSKSIHFDGRSAEMVGALSCEVEVSDRPKGHGYVIAEVARDNPFWSIGTTLRGHEFHNSQVINLNGIDAPVYRLTRGSGLGNDRDGLVTHNVLASYTHLHADGSPGWASGLVSRASQYAEEIRHG